MTADAVMLPIVSYDRRCCGAGQHLRGNEVINEPHFRMRFNGLRSTSYSYLFTAYILLLLLLLLDIVNGDSEFSTSSASSSERIQTSNEFHLTTSGQLHINSYRSAEKTPSSTMYRKHLMTKSSVRKTNSIVDEAPPPLPPSSTSETVAESTSNLLTTHEVLDSNDDDEVTSSATAPGNEGRTRKLPEAIIIGVKKGGTRALLEFLKIHPDIRAPGPEIHFFDRHFDKGLEWYRSRMPPTLSGQLTIEKTPSYFVTRSAPQRVRRSMPSDVRLIVVVRDPVTRALSDYTQALVKRPDLLPFERMAFSSSPTNASMSSPSMSPDATLTPVNTSWGAIRIGLYARHLERWLRWFPRDRFHFVNGERLVDDPAGEIGRPTTFTSMSRRASHV